MLRDEWKFQYNAEQLKDAALAKRDTHKSKLTWWEGKMKDIIAEVKEKGMEVDVPITLDDDYGYKMSNTRAVGAPRILITNDYQSKLNECAQKISEHRPKVGEYDGWVQVLTTQRGRVFELDHADWLFFFSA